MTYRRCAKLFKICGWLNYGCAAINIVAIGLAVMCGIKFSWINFGVFAFCSIVGYISFQLETHCLELAEYLKESIFD